MVNLQQTEEEKVGDVDEKISELLTSKPIMNQKQMRDEIKNLNDEQKEKIKKEVF